MRNSKVLQELTLKVHRWALLNKDEGKENHRADRYRSSNQYMEAATSCLTSAKKCCAWYLFYKTAGKKSQCTDHQHSQSEDNFWLHYMVMPHSTVRVNNTIFLIQKVGIVIFLKYAQNIPRSTNIKKKKKWQVDKAAYIKKISTAARFWHAPH